MTITTFMYPFTAKEALRDGYSKRKLRTLCEAGVWSRLRRNAFVSAVATEIVPSLVLRAGAVLPQLIGDPVLSHETAATLWGIDHLHPPTSHVQLIRSRRGQGRREPQDTIIHQAGMFDAHRTILEGLPITTPARTVIDIARIRGVKAGVVAADSALRLELCTRAELAEVLRSMPRWPFVRRARTVVGFTEPLCESPLESLSRLAFAMYAVPAPRMQATDLVPGVRVDFVWDEAKVVGEADGDMKYEGDLEVFKREKEREQRLVDAGFVIVRWGWADCFENPKALAERVKRALVMHSPPLGPR